ncbi:hypothetical protein LINPERHAP2_LOCUS13510 [Linum perenne]
MGINNHHRPPERQFAPTLFNIHVSQDPSFITTWAATCWNIWKARNSKIFRNELLPPRIVAGQALADATSWRFHPPSNTNPNTIPTSNHQIPHPHSQPPPPPRTIPLKVHCDASFGTASQLAAFGIVITNSDGLVCDGRSGLFHCYSPTAAEAQAVLEAVRYASASPLNCSIFTDCKEIVSLLNGPQHRWPWECYGSLGNTLTLLRQAPNISLHFTPRALNAQADWVAKSCRSGTLPAEWFDLML